MRTPTMTVDEVVQQSHDLAAELEELLKDRGETTNRLGIELHGRLEMAAMEIAILRKATGNSEELEGARKRILETTRRVLQEVFTINESQAEMEAGAAEWTEPALRSEVANQRLIRVDPDVYEILEDIRRKLGPDATFSAALRASWRDR